MMKVVDFPVNGEEAKEEVLFRFDFCYPPALIAELLSEYTHKEYYMGKELSDFEKDLNETELKAFKQAVSYAKEIGAYKPAKEKHFWPHIILWNKTDGTIRSLNEDYSGFIDDPNDFLRYCSTKKDIMEALTCNDTEKVVYTRGLASLEDEQEDPIAKAEKLATKYAVRFGATSADMALAISEAKVKAKLMEAKYKEKPLFILGSCIAQALEIEVNKACARKGIKARFTSSFSLNNNVCCEYSVIHDDK